MPRYQDIDPLPGGGAVVVWSTIHGQHRREFATAAEARVWAESRMNRRTGQVLDHTQMTPEQWEAELARRWWRASEIVERARVAE